MSKSKYKGTPGSDHFWKLTWRKSACCCGAKHISCCLCRRFCTLIRTNKMHGFCSRFKTLAGFLSLRTAMSGGKRPQSVKGVLAFEAYLAPTCFVQGLLVADRKHWMPSVFFAAKDRLRFATGSSPEACKSLSPAATIEPRRCFLFPLPKR